MDEQSPLFSSRYFELKDIEKDYKQTMAKEGYVDIMEADWQVRRDRDQASADTSTTTMFQRLSSKFGSDMAFALGNYKGGGFIGPPFSIQQIFTNRVVDIPATPSPSEGFESTIDTLDPSLELISKRMKEILSRLEGRCRMSFVRLLGWFLSKLWRVTFTNIMIDQSSLQEAKANLSEAANNGHAVMLLPTHRSHIDYLLMSYVCFGFNLPVPHIGSGDNLNIPLIGRIFAYSGAFFLRRSFKGDNLYKKVLYGYLLRKLREGAPIEVFVEGGRSRTGMISEPKVGMLLMAVRFVREGKIPDIMLLPSSIDYERTLETSGHVDQLLGMKKKKESFLGALRAGYHLLSGASNHGRAFVHFGSGISIKSIIDQVEERLGQKNEYISEEAYVNAVAQAVVKAQREASLITPVALVAASVLGGVKNVESSLNILRTLVVRMGGKTFTTTENSAEMIDHCMDVLKPFTVMDKKTRCRDNDKTYMQTVAKSRLKLRYSCGQLIPLLAPYSVVVTALHTCNMGKVEKFVKSETVLETASNIVGLIRHAVPGAKLDEVSLKLALDTLVDCGLLRSEWNCVALGEEVEMLDTLRILIAPSISACSCCLVATASLLSQGPVTRDKLIEHTRGIVYGQLFGESTDWLRQQQTHRKLGKPVGFPEALSTLEIRAALKSIMDMGIVVPVSPISQSPKNSHVSLVSFGSSKTFSSVSEETERKSQTSSASEAIRPEKEANLVLLAPEYCKGQSILQKLAQVQENLYRESSPALEEDVKRTTEKEEKVAVVVEENNGKKNVYTRTGGSSFMSKNWAIVALFISGALLPMLKKWRLNMKTIL